MYFLTSPPIVFFFSARFRQYHVQFFGDEAERGWINESSTMPFEGKAKFLEHSEEVLKNASKKQKPKLQVIYKVNNSRVRAWNIAITSAEKAMPMSKIERQQHFTFTYETAVTETGTETAVDDSVKNTDENSSLNGLIQRTPKKRGRKRKHKETVDASENVTPDPKKAKVEKSEDVETGRTHVHNPRSSVVEGSFEVFFQKHKDDVLAENPDFDDQMLVETLEQQWEMMQPKQKARYKCKFSGESPNKGNYGNEL